MWHELDVFMVLSSTISISRKFEHEAGDYTDVMSYHGEGLACIVIVATVSFVVMAYPLVMSVYIKMVSYEPLCMFV